MSRIHQGVQQVVSRAAVLPSSDFLELFPVPLKRSLQILVLLLEQGHLTLGVILLLLTLFELALGAFYLLLDVSQEEVLVQRVDFTDVRLIYIRC